MAALNWGLGHVVRLVPIIRELELQNTEIVIAGSGRSGTLLQMEFPNCTYIELSERAVRYGNKHFFLSLAMWLPFFAQNIWKEHRIISKFCKENGIGRIISDNRYGAYSKHIHSVLIIHQLNVLMPKGFTLWKPIFDWVHSRLVARFTEVWIPDEADAENRLSGILSETNICKHKALSYTGYLSDLKFNIGTDKEIDLLFVLSGPEPTRTQWEKQIALMLANTSVHIVVVRGTESERTVRFPKSVSVYNLVMRNKLNKFILASDIVISRSGYTSIMDYVTLGSKAILVPTPGQTEQEYLAKRMNKKAQFAVANQDELTLPKILELKKGLRNAKPYINKLLTELIKSRLRLF